MRDALAALVGFGLRIAQVAAELVEAEGRIVSLMAGAVPASGADIRSPDDAERAGQAMDAADAALALATPRVAVATQSFERVSRAVRRTVALVQRIDAGWPRRGGSDDRRTMARRQIARGVGERIARQTHGEAAERLFDDLDARLDALELDGELNRPIAAVIAAICRDLGLAEAATQTAGATPRLPPNDGSPADTG